MFKDNQNTTSTDNMTGFIDLVKTKYDKEELIREIDIVLESLYLTHEKALAEALVKRVRVEVADLIKKAKEEEQNFQGFLKAVRQIIFELKEIELTIAVDPTEELVNQISDWIKISLKESLVINFTKNPDLIGGAQIAYKGKYFEYSIKKELEKVLSSNI